MHRAHVSIHRKQERQQCRGITRAYGHLKSPSPKTPANPYNPWYRFQRLGRVEPNGVCRTECAARNIRRGRANQRNRKRNSVGPSMFYACRYFPVSSRPALDCKRSACGSAVCWSLSAGMHWAARRGGRRKWEDCNKFLTRAWRHYTVVSDKWGECSMQMLTMDDSVYGQFQHAPCDTERLLCAQTPWTSASWLETGA